MQATTKGDMRRMWRSWGTNTYSALILKMLSPHWQAAVIPRTPSALVSRLCTRSLNKRGSPKALVQWRYLCVRRCKVTGWTEWRTIARIRVMIDSVRMLRVSYAQYPSRALRPRWSCPSLWGSKMSLWIQLSGHGGLVPSRESWRRRMCPESVTWG